MAPKMPTIPGTGLLKGMWLTLRTLFKKPVTINYPKEKEVPVARARGVIALDIEACTVCMLCARECPDWCIYIEGHKELQPPSKPGGRPRSRATLDRFDIDYALCMYCGICVEVCPFDALFWSPEYEYSEGKISDMLHDKERLTEWLATVPAPPPLEKS
jgi:NADH-quinone oxidoreductase subunit I